MAGQSTTPSALQSAIPTAKEKKYDRQLRLWAASGQAALENAKVLLLNSGAGVVGIETLKNLVLPGMGSFTIVDDADVTEEDLGVNFFLTDDSLGQSRAAETCKYLNELNPEVQSHAVNQSVKGFVQDSKQLATYTLIILVGSMADVRNELSAAAWQHNIPLFYVQSIGFYSHFSIQLPEKFPVVDTHPDPASTQDLRLLDPWPEFLSLKDDMTKSLGSLDDHVHGHIPYALLLLHYLDEWKDSHQGQAPVNYSEKKEFKSLVESGARTSNSEGGEENFAEASAAVLKSLNPSTIPSGLREIFQEIDSEIHDLSQTPSRTPANFWLIAYGIREFSMKHGDVLPLPGAVPDMKAQSADYVRLQNVYKQKARNDLAEVISYVKKLLEDARSSIEIQESEYEAFCKNAAHVKLIRGQPLSNLDSKTKGPYTSSQKAAWSHLQNPDLLYPIYLAFQAHDISKLSSSEDDDQNFTLTSMKATARSIMDRIITDGATKEVPKDEREEIWTRVSSTLEELHRANGAELHNISALTGGMVAQEAIKVLTKQYVPVDSTCLFDGVQSKTAVFRR